MDKEQLGDKIGVHLLEYHAYIHVAICTLLREYYCYATGCIE